MKKLLSVLLLCSTLSLYSQNNIANKLGYVNLAELDMKSYSKDTLANALVLNEHCDISFYGEKSNRQYFTTKVYKKIKIFNKNANNKATVKINLYKKNKEDFERLKYVKAYTFNSGERKVELTKDNIFQQVISENWIEVGFTFPNVKPGSVIEYEYEIESPFFFNLVGWNFQSDIPKLKSEFHAVIPGYWVYNRNLKGNLKLSTNSSSLKSDCFSIYGAKASCEELTFGMKDIPAYFEEEKYTTSKRNYISRLEFELSYFNYPNGGTKKYTTTWDATDKFLKTDEDFGKQLKYQNYFKKIIPDKLIKTDGRLKRAMEIYYFIQNHFILDEEKGYSLINVNAKKAFEEKSGSINEINLALINALNAAGIHAKIMLLSTRKNGFPTKAHPVLTDFDYLIAYVKIEDNIILLDASDKFLNFGLTPFQTLNGQGRVLDFDSNSFWYSLSPKVKSSEIIELKLVMDDSGNMEGKLVEKRTGYDAKSNRQEINTSSKEDYLYSYEDDNDQLIVNDYSNQNLKELDSTLIEELNIELNLVESIGNNIYFNPFLYRFSKNPFTLKERNYPINFGYNLNHIYKAQIEIPESFDLVSIPQDVYIKLPNNGGSYLANFSKRDNRITVYSKLKLNYSIYKPEKYESLKELFKEIIKTSNSLISLEKTTGS